MPLTEIEVENFTVFDKARIPFSKGLNVLIGENGVGKTHIMKLAYAACQAAKHDVSFPQKTTMLFRPDQSNIGRLVKRKKGGNNTAEVIVKSDAARIGMSFSMKTRKWDAEVRMKEKWEKQMVDLTSVFIPAKEILSNAWNLDAAVKMGNVEFDDTYLDIIAAAKIDIFRGADTSARKKYLEKLQQIITGKVTVQIFVSTHDYFLCKYIEVKRSNDSKVQYLSLYKNEEGNARSEISERFDLLKKNAIMDTFRELYNEEIAREYKLI